MRAVKTLLTATLCLAAAIPSAVAENGLPELPLVVDATSLDPFLWESRPVVVFADTPNDPRFIKQVELLAERPDPLAERDVVIILDADPSQESEIRKSLRPRGFMLAIIGKDGKVAQRKPAPWDVREITRAIDKMPLRKQEIRDVQSGGAG